MWDNQFCQYCLPKAFIGQDIKTIDCIVCHVHSCDCDECTECTLWLDKYKNTIKCICTGPFKIDSYKSSPTDPINLHGEYDAVTT